MPTAKRLRSDDISGGGTPAPLVSGQSRVAEVTRANFGTGDVRYDSLRTTTLTPLSHGAGDTFKIVAYGSATGHGVDGDWAATATSALAYDVSAADMQTALRTATGDTTLTVANSTPGTDPWIVTAVGLKGQPELTVKTCTGGMAIQVSRTNITYDDVPQTGTPGTVPSTNGVLFDQESSKGISQTVPLGYSIDSRGTGQTRGAELLPPTIDGVAGGTGQVVITGTEVASGGTDAVALYSIRKIELADHATQWVTVDSEDADADVTISSLSAGDYVLFGHTQTQAADATTGAQVSRPSAPVYFSVA